MVVISIMAIMSVTVVVSFNGLAEKIRVKETAGVIKDLIKQLELEVLNDDYQQNIIHFESDFLVVKSQAKGSNLTLNYEGMSPDGCEVNAVGLSVSDVEGEVELHRNDDKGNPLEVTTLSEQELHCVEFQSSKKLEWAFQLKSESDTSNVIRLIHFNLNRYNLKHTVQIESGNEYELVIEAPYAKEHFLLDNEKFLDAVILTVTDGQETENVQLQ